MFAAIDRWLKRSNDGLPSWVSMTPSAITGVILYIVVLESSLTLWQKAYIFTGVVLASSVIWTMVFGIYGGWRERRKQAQELQKSWEQFVEDFDLVCGELELYTPEGTIRGFITQVRREGDEIRFARNWVAHHLESQWLYLQSDAGTDFSISAIDGKGPICRADDTYFIDLPGVGAAVVYPKGHPDLLKLQLNVSLEQPAKATTV